MDYVRIGENIMKKDSICQVNIINQQNVTTAMNYLEKEKVQKSLRILTKFTDNKQINIIFYLLAVEETLEKYSRWFIAIIYLGLGIYILIENNSFDMLWTMLG